MCFSQIINRNIFLKSKDIRTKDPLIKKKKTHVLLLVSWMLTLVQKEMIQPLAKEKLMI